MSPKTVEEALEEYQRRDFKGHLKRIINDPRFEETDLADHDPCDWMCKGCQFCRLFMRNLAMKYGYGGPIKDQSGLYIVIAKVEFEDEDDSEEMKKECNGKPVSRLTSLDM